MGQPILKFPLRSKVDTGIRQATHDPSLVTEYECREAARYSLYNWMQWLDLDQGERAHCVAHLRIHNAVEANVNDAINQYHERMSRRTRGRR
jgi:hypothetical protein